MKKNFCHPHASYYEGDVCPRCIQFKETLQNIRDAVNAEPGITLPDLVREIPHHWQDDRSAATQIRNLSVQNKLPGVCWIRENRRLYYFPDYFHTWFDGREITRRLILDIAEDLKQAEERENDPFYDEDCGGPLDPYTNDDDFQFE